MSLAQAFIDLILRDEMTPEMRRVGATMERLRDRMERVGRAARVMFLAGAAGVAAFVRMAANFEETQSKFEAVFKGLTGDAEEWVRTTAAALQRSEEDLKAYLARLQDTFVPLGFSREQAYELARAMAQLGIDLASFNNEADAETIDLLTSAIVGNHEAVRRYGIILNEAEIQQEALNMGIAGGAKRMTNLQKVQARVNIIMRASADAQGDAARTAGSLTNTWKGVAAQARSLGVAIGDVFSEDVRRALTSIQRMLPAMREWVDENRELILTVVKATAVTLGLAVALGALATLTRSVATLRAIAVAINAVSLASGSATVAIQALGGIATIGAIAALALAFKDLRDNAKEFFTIIDRATSITRAPMFEGVKEARQELKLLNHELQMMNNIGLRGPTLTSMYDEKIAALLKLQNELREEGKRIIQEANVLSSDFLTSDGQMRRELAANQAAALERQAAALDEEIAKTRELIAAEKARLDHARMIAAAQQGTLTVIERIRSAIGRDINRSLDEEATRMRESLMTAEQRLDAELARLAALRLANRITQEEYQTFRARLVEQSQAQRMTSLAGRGFVESLTDTAGRIQGALLERTRRNPVVAATQQTANNTGKLVQQQQAVQAIFRQIVKLLERLNIPVPGYVA